MTATSNDIDRQAADWAAKSERGRVPERDQPALERWLAADARHRGAYMKALAVQIHLTKLAQANPNIAPKTLNQLRYFRPARMIMMGALAASLLLAISVGMFWPKATTSDYDTQQGAIRMVALPDGSSMTMNTASKAHVRYAALSREVALSQGEALFTVAKNKIRPFRVAARGAQVRAVGTSFSVKNIAAAPVEVLVREGVVAVETDSASGHSAVQVLANMRAIIGNDGEIRIERLAEAEVANALSWRQGFIFFAHRSLAEAATEFGRYSSVQIVVDDPAVARRVVSGLFKANDPITFAKATALALHLRVAQRDNKIWLTEKSY